MIEQQVLTQKVARGVEIAGSATMVSSGVGGWLAQNHDIIYFTFGCVGALMALCGWLTTLYFKIKSDARERELHEARMRGIRNDNR